MTSRLTLADLPPRYQAQIAAQLASQNAAPGHGTAPNREAKPSPRLRQASKGPNKTEAAFAAYLRAMYPGAQVLEQAVTLVIGNGVRYTPDMFVPSVPGHAAGPTFYETKGPYARDDAIVKLKVAARVHSWATFYLVTNQGKTGTGWRIDLVRP